MIERDPAAHDDLEREQRVFLRGVIAAFMVCTVAHTLITLSFTDVGVDKLVGAPVYLAFLIAASVANARGHHRAAATVVIGSLWLAMVGCGLFWSAVEPGVIVSFVNLVLLAGFTLGASSAAVTALLSGGALAGLVFLQFFGAAPPPLMVPPPMAGLFFFLAALTTNGVLVTVGLRRLMRALTEARRHEEEAREALERLAGTRTENEVRAQQGIALAGLAQSLTSAADLTAFTGDLGAAAEAQVSATVVMLTTVGPTPRVIQWYAADGRAAPDDITPLAPYLTGDDARLLASAAIPDDLAALGGWSSADDGATRGLGAAVLEPVRGRSGDAVLVVLTRRPLARTDQTFLSILASMLGAARDRALVEEELRQAQKLEVVGTLAGGVAHDFNNLLVTIIGATQLAIQDLGPDAPEAELLHDVVRAGEHGSMLTRQLLAFTRRRPERPELLNLGTVVRDLERLLRRLAGERIELSLEVDDKVDARVRADRGSLEQVLFNLVVNARDAIDDRGQVSVRVGESEDPDRPLRLQVVDTGRGIEEHIAKRIFEPFFTTKDEGKGTGLGLATVARVIEELGGSLHVRSTPGNGATFWADLPLAAPELRESERPPPVSRGLPGSLRILLVDDNELVRDVVEAMLRRLGCDVVVAEDGAAALARLTTGTEGPEPTPVDLILSDVVMPRLGGPELLRALRAQGDATPVLLMTGYADQQVDRDVLDATVGLLHKPFKAAELERALDAVLRAEDTSSTSGIQPTPLLAQDAG